MAETKLETDAEICAETIAKIYTECDAKTLAETDTGRACRINYKDICGNKYGEDVDTDIENTMET